MNRFSRLRSFKSLSVFCICLMAYSSKAQFQLNGSASAIDANCYSVTTIGTYEAGSVLNTSALDLSNDFIINTEIFVGCNDNPGADGMAFVLQKSITVLGANGGGLGYEGPNQSFAVEFDTYTNSNWNDPAFDHIAILKNGNLNHTTPNTLAGPVPASLVSNNIEDCEYHDVSFSWNATAKEFKVFFDCELRLSLTQDIVSTIFGNNPIVYWGFSAGTGGETNEHQFCLKTLDVLSPQADVAICVGDSVQISAPINTADAYTWTPTESLSESNIANPIANPDTTTTYYVTLQLGCDIVNDTIVVTVNDLDLQINEEDQTICPDQVANITTTAPNGTTFSWSNGETGSGVSVSEAGTYLVTGTLNACVSTDSVNVIVLSEADAACAPDTFFFTVPSAFSPNGDGINDVFQLVSDQIVLVSGVQIYNRWGEVVYNSVGKVEWNGQFKGALQPSDMYQYIIEWIEPNGAKGKKTGSLLLLL